MPIHDWTRVVPGTFHPFHNAWIAQLQGALNDGVLPAGYYALSHQPAADVDPDVLTLFPADSHHPASPDPAAGGVLLAETPPRVAVQDVIAEDATPDGRRQRLVIRHSSGDDPVAIIEVISQSDKRGTAATNQFVNKAVSALGNWLHLQVLDLFPPGPSNPRGMHAAIWAELGGDFRPPEDRPLTLAAYVADTPVRCYVEPSAVGMELVDLPLFLTPERYVSVPLERTYMAAYRTMPSRIRAVIEAITAV